MLGATSLKSAAILGGPDRKRATSREVLSESPVPNVRLPSVLTHTDVYVCPSNVNTNGIATSAVSSSPGNGTGGPPAKSRGAPTSGSTTPALAVRSEERRVGK